MGFYNVYDRTGNVVRGKFKTWKDAYTFLCVMNRFDWSIKKKLNELTFFKGKNLVVSNKMLIFATSNNETYKFFEIVKSSPNGQGKKPTTTSAEV